jgi:hypothetical protein
LITFSYLCSSIDFRGASLVIRVSDAIDRWQYDWYSIDILDWYSRLIFSNTLAEGYAIDRHHVRLTGKMLQRHTFSSLFVWTQSSLCVYHVMLIITWVFKILAVRRTLTHHSLPRDNTSFLVWR